MGDFDLFSGEMEGPCYISGPMTGLPEYNFSAFNRCEAWLKMRFPGLIVESPVQNGSNGGAPGSQPYGYYFRLGIMQLLECRSAVFLKDWIGSPGANTEYRIARRLGLNTYYAIEHEEAGHFTLITLEDELV